jgi:hypothetical protein
VTRLLVLVRRCLMSDCLMVLTGAADAIAATVCGGEG